jgi:hypothetical protein
MIIVIAHDSALRQYYGDYVVRRRPNHEFWQRATVIDASLDQRNATARLQQLLAQLQPDEPLCLVGHGNNKGIGDRSPSIRNAWWWNEDALAQLFKDHLPEKYGGPVLIESCGESVANLPPRIALQLDGGRLVGMWIYGHQNGVDITEPLPKASELGEAYYPGSQVT